MVAIEFIGIGRSRTAAQRPMALSIVGGMIVSTALRAARPRA